MSTRLLNPDSLFDRTFRPGHPFRPRQSALRRRGMMVFLVLLCLLISGYWYITDSNRVRVMAESYLSDLLGGKVTVAQAHLSIFEGLRLQDIRVSVDDSGNEDSLLFTARSLSVTIRPELLLRGQLQAKRIVAISPYIHLMENADAGTWNFQRLNFRRSTGVSKTPLLLPDIVLRNMQVDYAETQKGRLVSLGSLTIEAQLAGASTEGRYNFDLQSSGPVETIGPSVTGTFAPQTGQVTARLRNFRFGRDINTMLPSQVRAWWQQHQLDGRLDIPDLFYQPGRNGQENKFRVEMELSGGGLTVPAQEWLSAGQLQQQQAMRHATDLLRLAGLNSHGVIDRIESLVAPVSIHLENVSGSFVFTPEGIQLKNVLARIEGNTFQLNGRMDGYDARSSLQFHLQSLPGENLRIPHTPPYVTAMPSEVREIYERFRPEGICALSMDISRTGRDTRPLCAGVITILDGAFTFENFPYPLRKTTGRIVFGPNGKTRQDELRIEHLRGRGVAGGPNENSYIEVNGTVGPLNDEAGVQVTVSGRNIYSEPALRAALPRGAREGLGIFGPPDRARLEADGKTLPPDPNWPKFHGDFECRVFRPVGLHRPWTTDVDINLDETSGALAAFPYPLEHLSGKLEIREGHVDIIGARMKRANASLALDGRVSWIGSLRRGDAKTKVHLQLAAQNVPIDPTLLAAMPAARRGWLSKVGLGGMLDIDGQIDDRDYDLKLTLRDGELFPVDGKYLLDRAAGQLRLTQDKLEMQDLSAHSGQGELTADGAVIWSEKQPRLQLNLAARNLDLTANLYKALPQTIRQSWDQVQPVGQIDLRCNYDGPMEGDTPGQYNATLLPHNVTATVKAVPYRLDGITGKITVSPGKVLLDDLKATHGEAAIHLSGTGTLGQHPAWDLRLAGKDVIVDDELRKAVPATLASLLQTWKMEGKLDFDFSKLNYRATESPTTAPATQPADAVADVDFAVKLSTRDASIDAGVPLRQMNAAADLTGAIRGGKLAEFSGSLAAPSLVMAGRTITNTQAQLFKPSDQPAVQFSKLQAELAGGSLAGQLAVSFPDTGPSRYVFNAVLRDADVVKLTGDQDKNIQGRVTASLAIEGNINDPSSRVGRGDVLAQGKQMYRVPVLLGLMQIANLSLPISSPFNQATSRYTIAGQRITFEQMELRSSDILMQGSGWLDFQSKRVKLTFTTDNPKMINVPFFGELFTPIRHELLQIHVNGTLQSPKVSASTFDTFTTTIDEVFKGMQPAAKNHPTTAP